MGEKIVKSIPSFPHACYVYKGSSVRGVFGLNFLRRDEGMRLAYRSLAI